MTVERDHPWRDDLAAAESELVGVDQALTRLDDASYGTCERCDAPLGDDALARDPLARTCPAHA